MLEITEIQRRKLSEPICCPRLALEGSPSACRARGLATQMRTSTAVSLSVAGTGLEQAPSQLLAGLNSGLLETVPLQGALQTTSRETAPEPPENQGGSIVHGAALVSV